MLKRVGTLTFALVLVLALVSTSALAGAEFDQEALIKPIDRTLRFVFIAKSIHPWYDVVRDGAQYAIDEFAKMGIKIEMGWDSPPVAEITEHIKKIESNIAARPDGLAVAALDPATNAQIINDAVRAGLNVVTFDTDAPESERASYIGHAGNFEDGFDLGEFLAEEIGYKGEVAVLSGTLSAPNHVGRVEGFKAAMAQYPDIKVVTERADNDDLQKATDLTESILQAFPDLKGIFGCNATNPIGAARAITAAGKAGQVKIVGMDDLPECLQLVKDGTISAVKVQRQWEIGYWVVKYLVAMNEGHTIPKEHPTGSRILTKADL